MVDAAVVQDAIRVRAALEQSGPDHGPISVHDRMRALGLEPVPSTAALARIFRAAGVARLEPKKKPRASYRRFVYPAPNACWQLDATEYVLSAGRTCVIFQLIDDHSRLAIASHVDRAETSEGALQVVKKGIAVHGVPQRLLTDNGVALNPSRRGTISQLVAFAATLGIQPITGKPYPPPDHAGQERPLPPDPVPLPRQAAHRRHHRAAPGPGRRLRPDLQHPTLAPRPPGQDHTAAGLGRDREDRTTPTGPPAGTTPASATDRRRPDRSRPNHAAT